MNGNGPRSTPRTLEEWLRTAYEGCPPPEAFLPEETAALDPPARRRLDDHAESCPGCSAERELARLFAAGPVASTAAGVPGVRPEDLRYVVAQLEASSPLRAAETAPLGRVVPFAAPPLRPALPAPPARRSPWPARFAAAAVVLLAAGLWVERREIAPPPLPAPPTSPAGSVLRGGFVEPLAPIGEVASVPAELRWEPRPGAVSYRVRLRTVDDELLWEKTVAAPPARLPEGVAGLLKPAVAYSWSVEALDGRSARLAGSEPVRFRVRPAGEAGGS